MTTHQDPSIRNRLILWLASGLFVAALVMAASSLPPPSSKVRRAVPPPPASGLGPSIAAPATAHAPRNTDERLEDDDEILFTAMERLERRIAAAMVRARESVLTLEYRAADGPDDARRAAAGVVVDGRQGDVLSVRIDRPGDRRSSPIVARDAFGRRHPARWIAEDPETGLTLLRIPSSILPSLRVAVDGPSLGSQVFVVGNPFGLGHSVSRGQISGLNRSLKLFDHRLDGLIQVQTRLFPGDSGAAVVDQRGQWLGLVRSGLAPSHDDGDSTTEPGDDLGFAIPADDALWIASQLRERGRVERAYLGVRFRADDDDSNGDAPEGASLRAVLPDTPAARGGLQPGDRIVSFDGRPIRSPHDLTERLDRTSAERYVRLEVVRDGLPHHQQRSVWIQTSQRPMTVAAPPPVVVPTSAVAPAAESATDQPRPKPLGAPLPSPRADELQLNLPRAVVDRLEQLEHRLELLERAAAGSHNANAKAGAP